MKKTSRRRWLSMFLALAMCLTLAPAAWAADDTQYEIKGGPQSGYMKPGNTTTLRLVDADGNTVNNVEWESDNTEVATVHWRDGVVSASSSKAGKVTITAYVDKKPVDTLSFEVSGIAVNEDALSKIKIYENGDSVSLSGVIDFYGDASERDLTFTAQGSNIEIDGRKVKGLREGKATIEATTNSREYRVTFTVEVQADATTNRTLSRTVKSGEALPFNGSDLKPIFAALLGGKMDYITGLFVSTNQGTLYYGYRSEAEPGAGVGQIESYYRSPKAGQRGVDDITFVAKPGYAGDATITYTAVTAEGTTYSCKINLTIQGSSGSGSGSQAGSISTRTDYNTPVQFNSTEFGTVCREKLGTQLNYVIFSQPPERQGVLYTNYSSAGGYGSVVDIHRQYSRKEIDDVWFVPASGYSGTVTVYYTGFGTNGRSYSGQVIIEVDKQDQVATGGLSYNVAPGGVARFDDADFDKYCAAILDEDQTLSAIRFESLPSESDGVLYYDYTSSGNTGSRAAVGTIYYFGSRAPRIDRLAFVPAAEFTGSLKIPFTGWTMDGTSFSGSVEINVRGGVTSGDIYYYCAPGRTVYFLSSDFTSLSRTITGRTLDYIRIRSLPGSSDGYLYYNNSRVSGTGMSYSSGNISRLSFRASSSFTGPVNISFEGRSTGGDTFTGVVTIGTSAAGSSSSNSGGGNIRYTTDSNTAAVFRQYDFDALTDWTLSSVRFDPPPTGQGSLYRNYRSGTNVGTRIASSASIAASALSQVAFVPSSNYTGTVYIDFTATTSGGTFDGVVMVEVGQPPADATARYSTRTAPVRFNAGDLTQSGSSLSYIRFTSLPPSTAGYLYYQYASPTNYGRQVDTGTTYQTSGGNLISDLTFMPRAGYSGTVTIPYTGTNSSGTSFNGEVIITVSPTSGSSYFSDMAGYSAAQQAAVDFLYDNGITRGMSVGQYGPENSIRRGDFALMLYDAFALNTAASGGAFVDVAPGAYYAAAVNALYARGIVSGIGNGYYAPDSTLTRQDAICMVQRALRAIGWNADDGYANALSGYGDGASVSGYAQGAMALAVQRGYLPTVGGLLSPQQPLTRVDMAELLHRVLTY